MGAALCNIIYYKRRVVRRWRLTLSKKLKHCAPSRTPGSALNWRALRVARWQSGLNPILGVTSRDRLEADGFDHPDDFIAEGNVIALNYDQLPFSCTESRLPAAN